MMLIVERSAETHIIGTYRKYTIWDRGSMLPVRQIAKAEIVLIISPDLFQLQQLKQTSMTAINVYVALGEGSDQEVRQCAERYGFNLISYDVGHEENLINSMLSVFNANESFGADAADIRKLFSKSGRIYYKFIDHQITAESINKIHIKGQATSIVTTLFYDDAFSFDAVETLFTWLKDKFSTMDIVSSYTGSGSPSASLGLFLALD